jgi:hypothetical protein
MKTLTDEIMNCLRARLWYAALVLTLMLPDVCAALESANGQSTSDRYKAWCDIWLKGKYVDVSADDLYYLRCGVAHQARFSHHKLQYDRIFFTLRSATGFFAHMNIHKQALNLDLVMFCNDVIDSVEAWYAQHRDDRHVQGNLSHLVQYYPNGLLDVFKSTCGWMTRTVSPVSMISRANFRTRGF